MSERRVLTLYPYLLHDSCWVFDDVRTGLKEGAFVLGMTEMISPQATFSRKACGCCSRRRPSERPFGMALPNSMEADPRLLSRSARCWPLAGG
jgi:hypothetical protein